MVLMGQVMSHEPYASAPRVFVIVDNGRDQLLQEGEELAFTARYNQTARPFNWKFTAADVDRLLHRISARQEPASPPQAA